MPTQYVQKPVSALTTQQLVERLKALFIDEKHGWKEFMRLRNRCTEITTNEFWAMWATAVPNRHAEWIEFNFMPTHRSLVTGAEVEVLGETAETLRYRIRIRSKTNSRDMDETYGFGSCPRRSFEERFEPVQW